MARKQSKEIAHTSYFFLYFSNASFASKCTSLMNAMLQITYAAIAMLDEISIE